MSYFQGFRLYSVTIRQRQYGNGSLRKDMKQITQHNERTFSEQAHDTPRLPTLSYWQQYIFMKYN
jgi:hypothetical protein